MNRAAAFLWAGLLLALMVAGCPTVAVAQNVTASAYDVVSIKPNKTTSHSIHVSVDPGIYNATNVSLKILIEYAYNLKTDEQISGLPGWTGSTSFDIEAKVDPSAVELIKAEQPPKRNGQQRVMMQSLLADRFQLKIHHEQKILPAYSLVVAKGGVKFKEAAPNPPHTGTWIDNLKMTAYGISMESLASILSRQVDRTVVDRTGLAGKYDLVMQWTPDDMRMDSKETTGVDSWPSIYTALQEQLGLKLDVIKAPVDTIVVDRVEEPSAN